MKITKNLYINLKSYNFLQETKYKKLLEAADTMSIWSSISGTVMSGIKLLTTDIKDPSYQTLINNYDANKTAVTASLTHAKNVLVEEIGIAGGDAKKAGSDLLEWIVNKLNVVKDALGTVFGTIINAITTAARTAFDFLKGLFSRITGADQSTEGVWAYFKSERFLDIPASSWLIWGTIAAFSIIVFAKFVKWLKNRKKTETSESFNNYILNDLKLLEEVRLTEAVSANIYKKAGESAMDLQQDIEEVKDRSGISWTTIKIIGIVHLIALGIYGCVKLTADGTA